jgi:effector-binding domain-containing protein
MVAPSETRNSPVIIDSPGRHVIYQHFVVPEDQLSKTIPASLAALYAHISRSGAIPAGPPFVIYHSMGAPWQLDVCAPVAAPLAPDADFLYMELPPTRVVSLRHVGPYQSLGAAYGRIQGYIVEQGLEPSGAPRETYLSEPETPPEKIETIIEFPIS